MSRYVNSQIDVAEVLLKEFELKVSPKQKFSCKSPNHRDSDASCQYFGETEGSYCFGCGKSYWAIDYIMFARDINYYQALKVAEEDYGAELPAKSEDHAKVASTEESIKYDKLLGISISSKKALNNFCVALRAIDEGNDENFNKYCKLKGIPND